MALTADNRWARITIPVKPLRFGSFEDFEWYFSKPSGVAVTSVGDVCEWLRACSYESDETLFGSSDYWQHPEQFERIRSGDCEDHALWAWRKLVELGVDAEFVVGRMIRPSDPRGGYHAWVLFRDEAGMPYLLEAAAKDDVPIVAPLADLALKYMPHHAVDARFATSTFMGLVIDGGG
jgi:hypothetical protein